jgi:hypothetical protein
MPELLLSTAYLAPVQYYAKLMQFGKETLEVHENYSKQTYRNRCNIYGPNGIQTLSIPVSKSANNKMNVKEVEIDYSTKWQKIHFRAIESAYRNSPFYDYFIDDLASFYQNKFRFLFDFNIEIQKTITKILGLKVEISFTEKYNNQSTISQLDYRDKIHPKKCNEDPCFVIFSYTQVFITKFGFIPNLSIIDLLFNEGMETVTILMKSAKTENVIM